MGLLVLCFLHLLHKVGLNNAVGVYFDEGRVLFHLFYVVKDLLGNMHFLLFSLFYYAYVPQEDADNIKEANA